MDVDVVPMCEFLGDDFRGGGVVARDIVDGKIGEDDTPAEGHARRIALENFDIVAGIAQLHRDGEIEPRRPAADARDLHAPWPRNAANAATLRVRVRTRVS